MNLLVVLGMDEADCDVGSTIHFNRSHSSYGLVVAHKISRLGLVSGAAFSRVMDAF